MTEETKKRYVAVICSKDGGLPGDSAKDIKFVVDLGSDNGIKIGDILEITKGAFLGQWGDEIRPSEITIKPSIITHSLEEFKEFCEKKREESERGYQERLEEEKKRKKEEIKMKKAREGKETVYEVYEKIGGNYEYRETFSKLEDAISHSRKNKNYVVQLWVAPENITR